MGRRGRVALLGWGVVVRHPHKSPVRSSRVLEGKSAQANELGLLGIRPRHVRVCVHVIGLGSISSFLRVVDNISWGQSTDVYNEHLAPQYRVASIRGRWPTRR